MCTPATRFYEFGPYTIDAIKRILLRAGEPVPLAPKAFDTLLVLVEHRGQVLKKEELIEILWPDSFVEEGNLTYSISMLRKALGESPNERRYIVTIPGRGYKFAADVKETDGNASDVIVARYRKSSLVIQDHEQSRVLGHKPKGLLPAHISSKRNLVLILLAGISIGGVGFAVYYFWQASTSTVSTAQDLSTPINSTTRVRSIAVLPFKPLVADQRDESLELGMADTLIVRLSNLSELTVRPFSSVRKFSGLEQDALAAGRELGVESVLDGQIQRWGERIRVTARLIEVGGGKQLWAGQFDEKFTDIFALQDLISEKVTSALALKLTGEEQRRLTKHYTENAQAYQKYLYGRFYRNKRTEAGSKKAIDYFEEAIAMDPNYALAYSGLSEGYIGLAVFGAMSPKQACPKAREAALKALETDDHIAESHVALAHFKAQCDHERPGAEREYQRAIELNPGYADAYRLYAILLMQAGRHDEAFAKIQKALEIDPTSVIYNVTLGFLHYFARRYDQAVEQLRKTIDMEPGHWMAHYWLAQVYAQKGIYEKALLEAQKARDLSGDSGSSWVVGYVHAVAGRRAEAHQQINQLLKLSNHRYMPPYDIAQIYAGLGDKSQAFAWLEKANEGRSRGMDALNVNPVFDTLRSDARFAALTKRIDREWSKRESP
jgi:DNA-binding winged helix-turn-helix (wHTH) protein/TolB-like protein/Flp pilus assembly protein TadD